METEVDNVVKRYSKRNIDKDSRYNILNLEVLLRVQYRQRELVRIMNKIEARPLSKQKVIEIGCGNGFNLLELVRLGFSPKNLLGNELLSDRLNIASYNLPNACQFVSGDASQLDIKSKSMDMVYQSTVFSSLLDDDFQRKLADKMWDWVRPGGGVLWYDFIYNNPRNKDVRGVSISRIKELFPEAKIIIKKVTLAPPISRRVVKVHPFLYAFFNLFPFLRTHVICYIQKV